MLNKLTVIGRLASDPQLKDANGTALCNFRLASDSRRKDESGEFIPNFYNVDVWRAQGENCAKYLHKGDMVSVVGDLALRTYVDSKGQQRMSPDLTANEVIFLQTKRNETAAQTPSKTVKASTKPTATVPDEEDDDEDLPF